MKMDMTNLQEKFKLYSCHDLNWTKRITLLNSIKLLIAHVK